MSKKFIRLFIVPLVVITFTLSMSPSQATIVVLHTSHGDIKVNLYDEKTPASVANFLSYVNDGSYDNTIIHRSVNNFIIQGGGFRFEGTLPPTAIAAKPAVVNEAVFSNVIGTIAMAKRANSINSATNQWFINLTNNSANLDLQNGGFTVFGEVIENSMAVVNAIAAEPTCDLVPNTQDAFDTLPMPNYSPAQCSDTNAVPGIENFVTINSIIITDSSPTTASTLSPVKNTLVNQPSVEPPKKENSSGGSFTWWWLILTSALLFTRQSSTK